MRSQAVLYPYWSGAKQLQSETGYIDERPLNASSTKPLATHGRTIHWVKLRRTQCEHMFSGLPLKADLAQCSRHFAFVPRSGHCDTLPVGAFIRKRSDPRIRMSDVLRCYRRHPLRPTQTQAARSSVKLRRL